MKNTLRRRTFISAIAMLLVSAIVLTSSTFAWFSMAKRVEVETMELNITSPDGVQLSANTSAFTTKLTAADLKGEGAARWKAYEGHKNNFPELLSPSSSNLYVAGSLPGFHTASIDDAGKMKSVKVVDDTASGYVAFDIFVKVSEAQKIYFGDTTVICDDNPDVPSAMRVGVVDCGVVAAKAEAAAIQAVLPANVYNHNVVMYAPNATNHTDASGYADGEADVPDRFVTTAFENVTPGGKGNNIAEATHLTATTNATYVTDETKSTEAYFNAEAGVNRVRVYLWMEGNDVDCENSVAGATIKFNLVLTIA
ncbi:MAG: hypothetical protein IKJ69_03010 [Clostridia bacterium]|nr:hypothetical protein [Clostridia bacterium]